MGTSRISHVVMTLREHRLVLQVVPRIAVWLMIGLYRLLRIVHVNRGSPESCWTKGGRIIFAFWHGRLLMMPFAYPGKPVATLISQHRDG